MPKVVVLNNYPLDRVWKEVRLKETPDHLLFGINYFHTRNYDVKIVPCPMRERLRIRRFGFPIPLGNLSRQKAAWDALKQADILYAACGTETYLLQSLHGPVWCGVLLSASCIILL